MSPSSNAPALACDSHLHIYDPHYTQQGAKVECGDVADYKRIQQLLGTSRAVVVQPRVYGTDNTVTLAAIQALGEDSTRGIAVVSADISESLLEQLHEGGIRGIRFSFHTSNGYAGDFDDVLPLARKIAALGWHIQVHWTADQMVAHRNILEQSPVPIVFDHLGRMPINEPTHPAHYLVEKMLGDGRGWMKLSGAYLNTLQGVNGGYDDTDSLAQRWIAAAPERLVWGSDWPHVTEPAEKPDESELFDLLTRWCGNMESLRTRILVDNPAELYQFSSR
ncbi:2-pyrone-4,6-dicarboxylate hydrolase [Candidimonas sp. SYP-B2681]|nr:2-pyrone-4,6-dicarboxylate hydrolase [Candidimonas sp. SYP-B2681]